MSDPGPALEFLILVAAAVVCILALGFLPRAPELLEFLLGAAAGFQAAQLGGKIHLFTIVCILYVLVGGRKTQPRFGRSGVLLVAVGFLIMSVPLGSLVISNGVALQLLALTLGAVVIAMKATPEAIDRMLYGLLAVCTGAAFIAIGQRIGVVPYEPLITSGFQRSFGIYTEPDWLGLFSAVGLVIAFRVSIPRAVRSVALVALGGALLLSFARAAWLALGIVIVVSVAGGLWMAASSRYGRAGRHRTQTGAITVAAVALAILAVVDFGFVNDIARRVTDTNTSSDRAAAVRRHQYQGLEDLAAAAPWHGLGLSASGRVAATGPIYYGNVSEASERGANIVATNWLLGWWVDGKYLAVPIIMVLIGLAIVTARTTPGLILILVLVNSLFSSVMMLPITWLAVGMALVQLPAWSLVQQRLRPAARGGRLPVTTRAGAI